MYDRIAMYDRIEIAMYVNITIHFIRYKRQFSDFIYFYHAVEEEVHITDVYIDMYVKHFQ